jgi:hypothetical protein
MAQASVRSLFAQKQNWNELWIEVYENIWILSRDFLGRIEWISFQGMATGSYRRIF